MTVFNPSLPPISSRTTSVRAAASAPTDSSNILAPATAQRGTIAETETKPAVRSRKSRRDIGMAIPPLRQVKRRARQHQVHDAAHLLVHVGRRVGPVPARAVVVRVHV